MPRMPDFLIIGAFKCGTSSLVDYLGQHPDVYLPWLQEPNFFAYDPDDPGGEQAGSRPEIERAVYQRHRTRTREQYAALFEEAPEGALVGECSPEYLRSRECCGRIAAALPDVKLIAILRDPAERAYSDYQAFVRDGLEHESFLTAIERQPSLEPGHQYVCTGFYGQQLAPFLDAFPREHIRVLLTEELRSSGEQVLRDTTRWLGADPSWDPDLRLTRNISGRPRNAAVATAYRLRRRLRPYVKPVIPSWVQAPVDTALARGLVREPLPPQARQRLVDLYREDVLRLQDRLDKDLSAWLAVP